MNKLIHAILLALLGLVVLAATSRALIDLVHSLLPLVLLVGVLAIVWRVVNYLVRQ
jgi:hypothetical protein